MRTVLAIVAALILSGCSRSTAFVHFTKLDSMQERAALSLKSATIVDTTYRKAIISTIYLNQVETAMDTENEFFLVVLYLRKKGRLQLPNVDDTGAKYQLTLNGKAALSITTIEIDNPLRRLMPINNNWNYFYKVEFPTSKKNDLILTLESNQSNSVSLTYQKDDL